MKRFHKLTAWLLTLAMIIGILPTLSLTAAADDTHTHPICCDSDCADHASQEWTAWNESGSLPTTSGYYYLTTDVKLTAKWNPEDDTYLCLNGKVIEGNGSENVICVNASFTLTDCDNQTTHKFSIDEDTGLWTLDEENGTKP